MSFVYARKIENSIVILADTKITFDMKDETLIFSKATKQKVKQFGIIKNVIISKNFCVSFAGNNIIYANKLLEKIKHITINEIIRFALEINLENEINGAEFIICYADRERQEIYQIKDGKCENVPVAWIGSYIAFRYFQGVRTNEFSSRIVSNNPLGVEVSFGESAKTALDCEYQKLFDSFHKTIFDCGDKSVGGFVIPVLFDTKSNRFFYKGYIKSYATLEQKATGLRLPMYQGADIGTYSVLFYQSLSIVGLYIPQNNCGIIYSHYRSEASDYDIKQTSSFWIPCATHINQLDFYVQAEAQGMKAPGFLGCEPDNIDEFLKRVSHYKKKPQLAILYINKAIEVVESQHREEYRLEELKSIRNTIHVEMR